jgi:putative protease
MARQGSWATTNRRHGCGLCAIPALLAMAIHGVKLVGRGAPTAQKIQNILLVRDFIALATTSLSFADYRQRAVAAHHRRFASPCSPNVCYYPEFYEAE